MNTSYLESLKKLSDSGRLRELKPLSGRKGCRTLYKGKEMLNLTSNDYLGIAGDVALHEKFYSDQSATNILDDFGLASTSSRLLAGDSENSHKLEESLRTAYQKEACLLFNSGYHANIGILPALFTKKDLILSDKLNHASIMDGMRLSNGQHKRYRHCDYQHLRDLLHKYRENFNKVVIVSESVFSMDGDVADIGALVEIKNEFDCMLYIDEAHSIGLYGASGLGMAEEQGQLPHIDLLVGTFGKALASVGAFVLCSVAVKNFLVNHSRSLIFTTALPPVVLHWNYYIFKESLGFNAQRDGLKQLSEKLRRDLRTKGLQTDGTTNIVPVMLGKDSLAAEMASRMREKGYLIFPVRPPSVPEGTARFRLSLTANMVWSDIKDLATEIAAIRTDVLKGARR